jgi:hypothetical protein
MGQSTRGPRSRLFALTVPHGVAGSTICLLLGEDAARAGFG